MFNKNEIAELFPFIAGFWVTAVLLVFTQPQSSVISMPQSNSRYNNTVLHLALPIHDSD